MRSQLPNLKKQMMNNGSYKFVALLAALILWLVVLGRKDTISTRVVDLEILLGPSYVVSNEVIDVVKVRLSGPSMALKKFDKISPTMILNLNRNKPGEYKISLMRQGSLELPPGVKILSIRPGILKVKVAKDEEVK